MFYERPGKKGVEESKQSLQKALENKKFTKASLTLQKTIRAFLAKQLVSSRMKTLVQSRIQDLQKAKLILRDKLSILPLKNLLQLIRTCKLSNDPQQIVFLREWIDKSLASPDPNFNLMSDLQNWNILVYIVCTYSQQFPKQKDLGRYILNILENRQNIKAFYRFLLLIQISNEYPLWKTVKCYLEQEILLNSQNILNSSIQNLLEFISITYSLHDEIDSNELTQVDKKMIYEGFIEIQARIIEGIISIPRIAKFILRFPAFNLIRWKEMIQSYYYGYLARRKLAAAFNETEIFLFGNLWEIFQSKLFSSMSPSDLAHFLKLCTLLVKNLRPSMLECSSNASITEPLNLKNLRKQITLFTDSSKLQTIFLKIFGNEDHFSDEFNEEAALALCEIYNSFLEKCQESKDAHFVVAGIIGGLAFNKTLIHKLWKFINNLCGLRFFLQERELDDLNSYVWKYSHVLSLFCSALKNMLLISTDQDFPFIFSHQELIHFTDFCISFTRLATFKIQNFHGETEGSRLLTSYIENLLRSVSSVLILIHEFNSRLRFVPEKDFNFDSKALSLVHSSPEIQSKLLHYFPFALPFDNRAEILLQKISDSKMGYNMFQSNRIVVRRDSLMADSIAQLLNISDIRGRLEVQFINSAGTVEDGYDAGGLFKEFWTSLSQEAFRPDYGLFCVTKDHCLYPNPNSRLFFGEGHLEMFYLVGRIIGKAIFERITIEPKFAEFFLRKMIGKQNFVEDLKSLDNEMYNNVMFLKNYQGNCEDLSLNFTVSNMDGSEYELETKGAEITVNNSNKLRYIYKLADYKLNLQIKPQCSAFFKGFNEVIPIGWVNSFTSNEMQILISGTTEEIDIKDLMNNTKYIDCSAYDGVSKNFWKVMEGFSNDERKMVLKFVTSCHRPPLMGFRNLHPPFTISKTSIDRDDQLLPTAQTCMNILRIPTYSSWKVLRDKLLIAIKSGAGFEFR